MNVAVYERVNKSVVHITTKGVKADAVFLLDLPTEGAGSGSVLDYEGHVLTNYHVIEEARQVQVTLVDGTSHDAKFVGADPVNDVAVIKLDAPREALYPVTLADSRKLKVGMRVYALGNPFGLERTLTTGIISSLNRSLPLYGNRTIKQIIQIDAAINPGNSGGPLLDTRGRLIGMNTAIASKTGQSSGVGFAIPSNLISRIVPQLIAKGKVTRPEVGIARVYETDHGLLVARLVEGGPAEKAGLRGPAVTTRRRGPFSVEQIDRSAADLIVEVDGEKVQTADDFLGHIESRDPGDTVTLTVVRGGREIKVSIRLSSSDDPRRRSGDRGMSVWLCLTNRNGVSPKTRQFVRRQRQTARYGRPSQAVNLHFSAVAICPRDRQTREQRPGGRYVVVIGQPVNQHD